MGDLVIIVKSEYIQNIRRDILRLASGIFPIIIEGPSGTGKEIIAKAIHNNSTRASNTMVTINCAAIPKDLEESEFFGHAKGSYTGATSDKEGLVAQANNSTLFLDEIGEISLSMQAKLLRVLDTGEYLPIGKIKTEKCDLRIISATNKSLYDMVQINTFRTDLYYRLKGASIKTLPITQHKEDIQYLVRYFLALQDNTVPKDIDPDALGMLMSCQWTGNVRELRYTMEVIGHAAIGLPIVTAAVVGSVLDLDRHVSVCSEDVSYNQEKDRILKDFEIRYFSGLLLRFKGNVSKAAKIANMYRPNFSKKLKNLGINPNSFRK
jgi:transcriptional regulator with PAS, ATPase and Fis domain